jgi:arginine deiminase
MFVRDTSAWLGGQLVLGAGSNPVRGRETCSVEQVYKHHPMFTRPTARSRPIVATGIEGGDLACLGDRSAGAGRGVEPRPRGRRCLTYPLTRDPTGGLARQLAAQV